MIVEPSVPLDVEMQPVIDFDLLVVTPMILITTPALPLREHVFG